MSLDRQEDGPVCSPDSSKTLRWADAIDESLGYSPVPHWADGCANSESPPMSQVKVVTCGVNANKVPMTPPDLPDEDVEKNDDRTPDPGSPRSPAPFHPADAKETLCVLSLLLWCFNVLQANLKLV